MPKVHFYSQDRKPSLTDRTRLKLFIEQIFNTEKTVLGSLSYIFCSDDYLLQINRDFLKHDYYTDIITFNLGEKKNLIEGEVYISVDRVKENARVLGTTFSNELHRVIFHGALHLCGFKDKTSTQGKLMRLQEDKYLKLYFP